MAHEVNILDWVEEESLDGEVIGYDVGGAGGRQRWGPLASWVWGGAFYSLITGSLQHGCDVTEN